jgi:hypothetical protein
VNTHQTLTECVAQAQSRLDFWCRFITASHIKTMAEIGVYEGDFAAAVLKSCQALEKYYMVDPWRHLDDWNKPANEKDEVFEKIYAAALERTEFAAEKRTILRGKTTEIIDAIPDNSLDFAYIDGDHTLKGTTIDLVRLYPKIRPGGWIGGDDFSQTVWQHRTAFEPTLVFPFAVYFAEAVGSSIYGLPFNQFLIEKQNNQSFTFIDLMGQYSNVSLRNQFHPNKVLKLKLGEFFGSPVRLLKRAKNRLSK